MEIQRLLRTLCLIVSIRIYKKIWYFGLGYSLVYAFGVCRLHLHLNNVLDDSLNIAEVSLNNACAVFDPSLLSCNALF